MRFHFVERHHLLTNNTEFSTMLMNMIIVKIIIISASLLSLFPTNEMHMFIFSAFNPTQFHSLDTINTYTCYMVLLFYLLYGKNLCTTEYICSLIQRNGYLWIVPQGYIDALRKSSSYSNLMFRCAVHIDSIYAMLLLLIFNKKFPWNLVICCLIVFMRLNVS